MIKGIFVLVTDTTINLPKENKYKYTTIFAYSGIVASVLIFFRSYSNWGLFTWREEDPKGRIILEPLICFLYSVYMQKVVLGPSARIFLEIETSQLRDRKILAPCKLLSLGRS